MILACALEPLPPMILTVGVVRYPAPPSLRVIAVTLPVSVSISAEAIASLVGLPLKLIYGVYCIHNHYPLE